jgi:hypothetical protein
VPRRRPPIIFVVVLPLLAEPIVVVLPLFAEPIVVVLPLFIDVVEFIY